MQAGTDDKKGKFQKNLKNSFWGMLDASLYPVANLAAIPILLRCMGASTFGFWILLNTLIIILQLFNFNLGTTAIRNIAGEIAANKTKEITETINGILHITAIIILVVLGFTSVLAWFAPKYGWFGFKEMPLANTSLCVLFAAIIACFKYIDQIFQNIIKAKELFKSATILNTVNRFSIMAINVVLAINKFSILQMLLANIAFIIPYLIVQFIYIKSIFPFYKPGLLKDKTYYRRLINVSYWLWLQALVIGITFQTDRLWVSSYSGLTEVSRYGLVSTIFNHIHMIFMAIVAWTFPRFAAMSSKGEDPYYLYQLVRGGLTGLTILCLMFFYILVPLIFSIWIGSETYNSMFVYIKGFVAFEIVFAHTILPFFYLNATGKERIATRMAVMYCTLCYVLMLGGLFLFHKPENMIMGMTLAMCICIPAINNQVQKSMGKPYSWDYSLYEMIPMYAAILLIYSQNTWLCVLLVAVVISLLWKFYLSNVFKTLVWKQVANT